MARGNAHEAIFDDDNDRYAFLDRLGRACERFDWRVWAYCLMGNHYHLLVETLKPSLSRGMREINGTYTQAYNRRHDRVGHLFQGRYKAILVDRDNYLLELSRYIVLNPVRAALCEHAGEWPWSSYRAVAGRAASPSWLASQSTLSLFASEPHRARRAYARFVADGVAGPNPQQQLVGQLFLGDEQFVNRVTERLPEPSTEVTREQRAWKALAQYERESDNRNAAIKAAYESGAYT
ncbi:MAG: transposase, partial [Gammaproteobacteria bacterium]